MMEWLTSSIASTAVSSAQTVYNNTKGTTRAHAQSAEGTDLGVGGGLVERVRIILLLSTKRCIKHARAVQHSQQLVRVS